MELLQDWQKIRHHFKKSIASNLHVAIASVNANNEPNVTSIGTFFLNKDQTGYYFEKFTTSLPDTAKRNKNICILGVNSKRWFWLTSLLKGRFDNYPGLKLYGRLGSRRKATPTELNKFRRQIHPLRFFKGYTYLWADMVWVREIEFYKVEKINAGEMTKNL